MALWSGRFEEGPGEFAHYFGASLETDLNMIHEDMAGSAAHARMLAAQGIISQEDADAILEGLEAIHESLHDGTFELDPDVDEDIHMAIERILTERIGEAGARLHTGRSRNDQVALDIRLMAANLAQDIWSALVDIEGVFVQLATEHNEVIMPGYTHLQHAQPLLFSHHMLAYFWMFARDFDRITEAYNQATASPLGAAALAGTSYPIDRTAVAQELGMPDVIPNSLDAVSDRDFLLDLEYACSVGMMHLSRLCEEIILWSSQEFGFISLPDAWSTGSSIMPQKKNPDFAELVRGKTGRVVGDLLGLLVTMKGLPLAYNKDMQECKEGALDAATTFANCLAVMAGMLSDIQLNEDAMQAAAAQGFTAATDVADYLAKKGMPFREAHEVVGKLVLDCEKRGISLEDLTLDDFKAAHDLFEDDILGTLDVHSVVEARTSFGGTSSASVAEQLGLAEARLAQMQSFLE
ncbi:MAG: argininosuccinate lyase [Eggerthellaceae bacterium]|nr:argininosuccinate lyase [Eggerthellaceae bacterium]